MSAGAAAEPRLAHGLGGLLIVAQHGMGSGQAVVRAAQQYGRELVPDGQDELQVGNGLFGSPLVWRQRGQGQPAEVLRRAKSVAAAWSSLASAASTSSPSRAWKNPASVSGSASPGWASASSEK